MTLGLLILLSLVLHASAAAPDPHTQNTRLYRGMCDASAGAALDEEWFAVANDEDNQIRIYSRSGPEPPGQVLDLSRFLGIRGKSDETDLEGAATIGQRIYWIGSHGRNREGRDRPNRRVFFATTLGLAQGKPTLVPFGKPYRALLMDLLADPKLRRYGFGKAAQLPPKSPGALNIEGLCVTATNELYLGFRNPVPLGRALLVPLRNPAALVEGHRAIFGEPVELELGGLGIRDLASGPNGYFILAGHIDGKEGSRLYRWKGPGSAPQLAELNFKGYNPEALIIYPNKGEEIQILSDDGQRRKGGIPCKALTDPFRQTFRSLWVAY